MILIKIGGGKQINWEYIAEDIADLISNSEKVIVVHGANGLMKEASTTFGLNEKIVVSPSGHTSRYTDEKTIEILTMVYSGLVNKKIVVSLQQVGINAVGLSGVDGRIWQGIRKENILSVENGKTKLIKDSLTGVVKSINKELINILLKNKYTPVLTIPAITEKGEMINVDNDRAIAVMIKDLKIKKLISLFEAPGLMKNINDKKSLIKKIRRNNLQNYINWADGRIKKKLLGLQEAFSNGLEHAYLGDGRIKNPIINVLKGKGTIFQ